MSDDRLHHLTKDARGRWEMRITVQFDPNLVGEPVRIKLGKCTEAQAIKKRDQHLRTLAKAGVTVKLRKQRRKR
jgi:hypothetical protein